MCFRQCFRSSAPNDCANSKNTKFRVKAMSAQWRLCLVARDHMHTVVAVNTVNRAAMGAKQGIATLTRKKPATIFFACSRHLAGQRFRQHTFQKTPRRMNQQNFYHFQLLFTDSPPELGRIFCKNHEISHRWGISVSYLSIFKMFS